MSEYYHKFKGMSDALVDLGSPMDDWILILNILHNLNQRFKHVGAIIRRYSPFLNFLKVRDDLLPEEIQLDTSNLDAALTAFYSNNMLPAPLLLPLVPPHPPGKNNKSGLDSNNNRNNNNRYNNVNGGKNSNNSGNCSGNNSSNTIATSNGATTNDDRGPPPW
jgi:hypothetical protein